MWGDANGRTFDLNRNRCDNSYDKRRATSKGECYVLTISGIERKIFDNYNYYYNYYRCYVNNDNCIYNFINKYI